MNTRDLSLRIWRVDERTLLVILVLAFSPCIVTAGVMQNRLTAPVAGSAVPLAAQPATHPGPPPPARPAPTATMVPAMPSLVNVPPLVFRGVELPSTMVTPVLQYVGMPIPDHVNTPVLQYVGVAIPDHVNTPGLRFRGQKMPAPMPRL